MIQLGYGHYVTVPGATFEEVVTRVRDALAAEGFGIPTEMDVGRTLEKKLGKPFRRYLVIGACLPELAERALELDPHLGLLLPCNVAIQEDSSGEVLLSVIHARSLFSLVLQSEVFEVAEQVDARLHRVAERVTGGK